MSDFRNSDFIFVAPFHTYANHSAAFLRWLSPLDFNWDNSEEDRFIGDVLSDQLGLHSLRNHATILLILPEADHQRLLTNGHVS